MTDAPPGPGWWLASDGRWYPPHLHPLALPGPPPAPAPPFGASPWPQPGTAPPWVTPTWDESMSGPSLGGRAPDEVRQRRLVRRVIALIAAPVLLIASAVVAIVVVTNVGSNQSSSSPTAAGNKYAESNLTNAVTEASAIYQNDAQTFTEGAAMQAMFTREAPEFAWTTGSCPVQTNSNCISYQVVSASTAGDAQALVLADASTSGVCWYLVAVEAAPTRGVLPFTNIDGGGLSYAEGPTSSGACAASDPQPNWRWASSYSSVESSP